MIKQIISVDSGKYATKGVTQDKTMIFPTKLLTGIDMDAQGNSFKVKYQGENYLVGELGEKIDFNSNKASLNHLIAIYTTITQLLSYQTGEYVQLVVGCPLHVFSNKEKRDEYKKMILGNRHICIEVNEIEYEYTLENVLILPETSGIVYTQPELFKNKRVAVVDLGGLNMNFCIYQNLIPEITSMTCRELGSYSLENEIARQLSNYYAKIIDLQQVRYIIEQGGIRINGYLDPKSIALVNNIIKNYVSKIIQEIQRLKHDLEIMDVVFIGGTSQLIKHYLKELISHAVIPQDSQWSNVNGFYKVGIVKYGQA